MRSPRAIVLSLVAAMSVVTLPAARGDVALPTPSLERVALADHVVIGRVVGFEAEDILLPISPGDDPVPHRVAAVAVTERVYGDAKVKSLRVAFPVPGSAGIPKNRRQFTLRLAVGDFGLFFLRKHHRDSVNVGTNFLDFIPDMLDKQPAAEAEFAHARRLTALLSDPTKSLQAKDREDRYLTAAMLALKYRNQPPGVAKTEPISAAESRLILSALVEQPDWNKGVRTPPTPWLVFYRLGITDKDGWVMPKNIQGTEDLRKAAQAWFQQRGQDYRIQRFVAATGK
jgi:hypothetical protein